MCLLFFQLGSGNERDSYKLILVNVRDEFYTRPAKPAHFWAENDSILGGTSGDRCDACPFQASNLIMM